MLISALTTLAGIVIVCYEIPRARPSFAVLAMCLFLIVTHGVLCILQFTEVLP